jgi:hypothetical protein
MNRLYDLMECRRHITEIYTHLIFVLIKPSILKLLILLINGLYLHCVIEKNHRLILSPLVML